MQPSEGCVGGKFARKEEKIFVFRTCGRTVSRENQSAMEGKAISNHQRKE
jgi:hypothetical protein